MTTTSNTAYNINKIIEIIIGFINNNNIIIYTRTEYYYIYEINYNWMDFINQRFNLQRFDL